MINMEVDTVSYKHLQKTLETIGTKFPKEVVSLLHKEGLIIETQAKKNLIKEISRVQPKGERKSYFGILSSSIHSLRRSNGVAVGTTLNYAPYVEFGTGERVDIPEGWREYAAKFKGTKKVKGVRARPYLVKAFIAESEKIPAKLHELYKRLIR